MPARNHQPSQGPCRSICSRRELLAGLGDGLGLLALTSLLAEQGFGNDGLRADSSSRLSFPPRAKRVVQLFMAGAASHLDLFDFKPELIRRHGQPSDFGEPVEAFQDGLGPWKRPVWEFKPYGECGKMLSEVVTDLGACVDDMAFIHNMVGRSGVHSTATLLQSTGFSLPGFPGMGSWISYGLGSENDNLPTFVVLPDHRGLASGGVKNWDAACLPAEHSGTVVYPSRQTPIEDLAACEPGLRYRRQRIGHTAATGRAQWTLRHGTTAGQPSGISDSDL